MTELWKCPKDERVKVSQEILKLKKEIDTHSTQVAYLSNMLEYHRHLLNEKSRSLDDLLKKYNMTFK